MSSSRPESIPSPLAKEMTVEGGIRIRSWKLPSASPSPRWPASAHSSFEISWVAQGQAVYSIGRSRHTVREGEAMLVPEGQEHQTEIAPGTRAGSIWIARSFVDEIRDEIDPDPSEPLVAGSIGSAGQVLALGELLRAEAHHPAPGQRLLTHSLVQALVVALLRGRAGTSKYACGHDRRIERAIERIESSFSEPLSLQELAKTAGMSPFHFSRVFRKETGRSPYQYLIRIRVERARQLLASGAANVTEAAHSVGFSDLGRFGRAFKRELGRTPSEARFAD